jgi:hypothetical protein
MWKKQIVQLNKDYNIDNDLDISNLCNQNIEKAITYLENGVLRWPYKYAFIYCKKNNNKYLLCSDNIKIPETHNDILYHKQRVLDVICKLVINNKFKK